MGPDPGSWVPTQVPGAEPEGGRLQAMNAYLLDLGYVSDEGLIIHQ